MRRTLAAVLIVAGGAGLYLLRPTAGGAGCPDKDNLAQPVIAFTQQEYTVDITVTNPNRCYGFRNEPVELSIYGPNGNKGISYYADSPPHSDVGVCCTITLPPRGQWKVRLGEQGRSFIGSRFMRICNIHVQLLRHSGPKPWVRMPEGGVVVNQPSFPPDFVRKTFPPKTPESFWFATCGSASASPAA